jgi:hypothetical protein
MANLRIDWFGRSLSRRADKTSNTYAKVNNVTGKTFLVTLRNPYTSDRFKNANIAQNNKMGALWMGIAAWVKQAQSTEASAEDAAQLERFVKGFKSQHKYATLRGFIAGKRYATVAADYSSVTIADGEYTKTVEFVFNARPLIDGQEDPEFSGSTDSGNSGSTGGNSGSAETVRLTVSAGNGGKVKIGDGEYGAGSNTDVAPGTSVSISAQPNAGYSFSQWSDGNTSASRSVAVNAAMTLTASFTLNGGGSSEGAGE